MEEEGIGLVLARATELRLKIGNCIHRASSTAHSPLNGPLQPERPHRNHESNSRLRAVVNETEDEENEEEAERLLNICDALESLETQLSALQALQQEQQYEKEVALVEIESSRKTLIDKLREYKGKELEVIGEASIFASETVEHNNDLLLPPYPSRPPCLMRLDKEYLSQIPSMHKAVRNGLITIDPRIEAKKSVGEKEQNHVQAGAKNSKKGLGLFISSAAKTMLTVVGVVSILSLSGFGRNLGKKGTRFKVLSLLQRSETEDERSARANQCPPGRILVVENGEARCLVKERVEVPFSAVAATPDINYGCG
ncbi:hypothetical protein L6164_035605 [Bauhinia variegata]|uniref:Uncharacterized protein n=1 Tax=Bauhinia variegata TaxID=167791 RepID=A0ACB9KEG2_BAUVA|nr:hypothetical protein L6164_035605 [Bauhinia variegata]